MGLGTAVLWAAVPLSTGRGEKKMDSLTRDVEKIFNASREMGYQEIYDEKTMAFKVLKRLFDITASSA